MASPASGWRRSRGANGEPPLLELVDHEHTMAAAGVTVTVEAPAACPQYAGAIIRGVTVGPSPVNSSGR